MPIAVLAIAVVTLFFALNAAAVVVMPIVASLLLCALFWPLRRAVSRVLPAWAGAAACTLVMTLFIGAVIGWASYASVQVADQFESSRDQYIEQYNRLRETLSGFGVPNSTLPELNEAEGARSGPLLPEDARSRLTEVAAGGLRSMLGILTAILLTVFLAFLALAEGENWAEWLNGKLRERDNRRLHELVVRVSKQTRWYFFGKSVTGLVSGLATWIWLAVMGVPLALIWGVFTLFMNYVPNIGALVSGVPATALAVVHLGWEKGLIVGAGLVVIETAVGNVLDPYIQGSMLKLSTFVVLASLLFWGWLWGAAGAVMAPVLTAALITVVAELRKQRHDAIEPA